MKQKPFFITSSIFTSNNSQFWNNNEIQIPKENFKDDYFLFFSNKKLTYLNKPLQKAGSIIRKQKKNGLYLWCDVTNAIIETWFKNHKKLTKYPILWICGCMVQRFKEVLYTKKNK